ncbi:MAG: thiamine phosphate synthase [Deltaproteobacteria bacterium]|nr:thiamine phosphate synthase [Deltaproteobacteria bacterium]
MHEPATPHPRKSARSQLPRLALVTGDFADSADLLRRTRLALEGGVRWVQLRAKQLCARDLYAAAVALRSLTREFGATFLVNDRIDVALACRADGVHLPSAGLSAGDARAVVGKNLLIGLSVHSREEIQAAGGNDLDYVQFGPVYDTPSKRAYGAPQGIAALAAAARQAHLAGVPLIAIGGAGPLQAAEVAAAGADAVAAIGAIWAARDIRQAASRFVEAARAAFATGAACEPGS